MAGPDQTSSSEPGYPRSRRIFGIVFIVSTLVLVVTIALVLSGLAQPGVSPGATSTPAGPETATPTGGPGSTPTPPPPAGGNLEFTASAVAIAASCLTSLTSLIGFVVTTVVGVRKERRESQSAELERKIRELELERQKLELERKKLNGKGSDENTPKEL